MPILGTQASQISGHLILPSASSVDYLVIAGGGAGGMRWIGQWDEGSGGGGAGGYLTSSLGVSSATNYTVTIGAGGSLGTSGSGTGCQGGSGTNSVFSSITSTGGGGGGAANNQTAAGPGKNGGSGGGGASKGDTTGFIAGTGTSGQGFDGGTGSGNSVYAGGGGGGASAVGAAGATNGGNGGAGSSSSINGAATTRAGGGGGGAGRGGSGGSGGAGGGGTADNAGTINTGSGGGGTKNSTGGTGGSGIVIIAYPNSFKAATLTNLTYTEPTRSGYRVYQITASASGTISF